MPENEFELLGRTTIGQYLPTGSALHRVDARIKLLMGLLLIAATVATADLLGLAVLFLAVVLGLLLARISLRFALSGLVPMLPFLVLLALLQVLAIPQYATSATVWWRWGILRVTDRGVLAGALLIGRFAVMVLGLSLFSFSTSTTELTHGIEYLLLPLQRLGFPAHEFALVVNIAIRFLPILAEETERLMKAQASRGADFGRGQRSLLQRTRRLLPLLVPLFLASLERANDLTEAMQARCYVGGRGRTHLLHFCARPSDYVALLITALFASTAVGLGTTHASAALWLWAFKLHRTAIM
jgi:energy-coupling factor transport system permease protein